MELHEVYRDINIIIEMMKGDSKKIAFGMLMKLGTDIYEYLIESNICPECGCELEVVVTEKNPTSGILSEYDYYLKCTCCGKKYESY